MASEPFPCEEGSETGLGPTVQGLHPEAAPDSKASQEEANSDVGEGSGEEPEDSPPGASADPATVGSPPAPGGSEVASRLPVQTTGLERPLGRVGGQDHASQHP